MVSKSEQRKINNNNRKRGAKFEKTVADMLDMVVVPYSGSNSRFGYGDIRDSEDREKAIWLGECKNISVKDGGTSITIKREWLEKNEERAAEVGCMPFLTFMEKGKPGKYIMLREDIFNIVNAHELMKMVITCNIECQKKSHNTKNIIVPLENLRLMNHGSVLAVSNVGDEHRYIIIMIPMFNNLLTWSKLHYKYGGKRP